VVPVTYSIFIRKIRLAARFGRFVTVLPLHRPCILLYCRLDGCMSTTWPLKICAMLKISSGRCHNSYGHGTDKTSRKPGPPPLRGQFVTVLPLHRPCIWLYCRSDGCMSTAWSLKVCAMLKISSGRRHMGTVPIKPPVSPPPLRGRCNGFTVTQAMYIVVLSIGRLYEHHMVPESVCDA
jgi:hypothetical protein